MREIDLAEERVKRPLPRAAGGRHRKGAADFHDSEQSLDELAALAETAGAVVVSRVLQNRVKPDPAMYIGTGKAEELPLPVRPRKSTWPSWTTSSPAHSSESGKCAGGAGHRPDGADSGYFRPKSPAAEGKLQVELAQLKYRLPRLTGLGTTLSRLGGGIGTRGPGETQLEVDRRRIRKRIDDCSGSERHQAPA